MKYNYQELDVLFDSTSEMLEQTSVSSISQGVEEVAEELQQIQSDIAPKTGLVAFVNKALGKQEGFKDTSTKVANIFYKYDKIKEQIDSNIPTLLSHSEKLSKEIANMQEYMDGYTPSSVEEELIYSTMSATVNNLILSNGRIQMQIASSKQISTSMEHSRPAFKSIIQSLSIENYLTKSMESGMEIMRTLGKGIDSSNEFLTRRTIALNKASNGVMNQALLGSSSNVQESIRLLEAEVKETLKLSSGDSK